LDISSPRCLKCDAHLTESIFQTRSRACLKKYSCDLHSPMQASWTLAVQDDADHSSPPNLWGTARYAV